ncbi:MAG TPA: class I SAM-dependent rRNA methyltransferase [Planctomycetota bacterium]|nr:class I SAM-dependent rRNA methyltransferase [Planctomycetota bacterium]
MPTAPGPAAATTVHLRPAAAQLARKGRPWFYRDDLQDPALPHAAIVRVLDDHGRDLGLGFTSTASKLVLRLCGPWPGDGVPFREQLFAARLAAAVERRAGRLGPLDGVRLVHGEADQLPGLVVDRYGAVLVLQVTSPAVEQCLDSIVPFLAAHTGAECVLARNDTAVRKLELLPQEVRLLHGKRITEVTIEEHGIRHVVRPFTGHKTGCYLDQAPARLLVKQLAKGRRVLDLFAYQGAFALAALAGGAASVLAVDQSEAALAAAVAAAGQNGLTGLTTQAGNVFDFLRQQRDAGDRYGLVVLDPPAFAKSRRELAGALRGYRDLNRLCLRLLAPHGLLLTCTCSHHVGHGAFEDVLRQAAAGLPFRVLLQQRLGAGSDHPVWLSLPESEYLKVVLLQRAD